MPPRSPRSPARPIAFFRAAPRRRRRSGSTTSSGPDAHGRYHTPIELSTANRPFIFNSVLGELQALGHSVRLVVHPIVEVARDAEGKVTIRACRPRPLGERPRARASSICTFRSFATRTRERAARRAADDAAWRGTARHRRLARDAGSAARRHLRLQPRSSAARRGGRERGDRVPAMAGRGQLRLPRHARISPIAAARCAGGERRPGAAPASACCATRRSACLRRGSEVVT